jgi:hypothetical protein
MAPGATTGHRSPIFAGSRHADGFWLADTSNEIRKQGHGQYVNGVTGCGHVWRNPAFSRKRGSPAAKRLPGL